MKYAQDVSGKRFALVGAAVGWPGFHPGGPAHTLRLRGATVAETITADLDYVTVFSGRQKGRAAGKRKAEKLAAEGKVEVLDRQGLLHMLRPELKGARFCFVGGFECEVPGLAASSPEAIAESVDGIVVPVEEFSAEVDYVVVGPRRKKGKTAGLRALDALKKKGAPLQRITTTRAG